VTDSGQTDTGLRIASRGKNVEIEPFQLVHTTFTSAIAGPDFGMDKAGQSQRKSCCMRVGPRCNANCANLQISDGHCLSWVSELRYLGIFIVKPHSFRCSFSHSKQSFFGAVNGVFGKLMNLALKVVILKLVKSKCLPILLYGLECCNLRSADLHSLDFMYNKLFMKTF